MTASNQSTYASVWQTLSAIDCSEKLRRKTALHILAGRGLGEFLWSITQKPHTNSSTKSGIVRAVPLCGARSNRRA